MTKVLDSKLGKAVVTGASAGIGRIYAERLAKRGHDLLLIARRGDRLEALAGELREKYDVAVETRVADLAMSFDLDAVAAALASDPTVTVLVNNAGTSTVAPVSTVKLNAVAAMIDLNVTALALLSRAVLPGFLERNKGALINVGSVLGFHATLNTSVYSATKSFVLTFTRSLQDEVENTDVRVQLVLPAATATDIWEISGVPLSTLPPESIMTADDCVDAALAGLDMGEAVTIPALHDDALFATYDTARAEMFGATVTGTPAPRYQVARE